MKKAKIKFTPLEHEYAKKYGLYPDRHFERLYAEQGAIIASQIVNTNMNNLYRELKAQHEKEQNLQSVEKSDNCPFEVTTV